MDIDSTTGAEKVTLVGELFRATEELETKAEEARANRQEEEAKRERLKEAVQAAQVQIDERSLQRTVEETAGTIGEEGSSPISGVNSGASDTGPKGSLIDVTA